MRETSLQDLPRYTPWPRRLLGLEAFEARERSIARVDSEYDKDKYSKCLEHYNLATTELTPEDVKKFEFGMAEDGELCVSRGERLYLASLAEARECYYKTIAESMRPEIQSCDCVVELGCGYGFNLFMLSEIYPTTRFVGGEYSQNALRLARKLSAKNQRVSFEEFNFYDSDFGIFEKLEGEIVVFTSHAIEQVPHAVNVIKSLTKCRAVRAAFHFEPVFESYSDSTTLGLMRRRYTEINDYNRDLLSSLKMPGIKIVKEEFDVFGLNPLNPTSILAWESVAGH